MKTILVALTLMLATVTAGVAVSIFSAAQAAACESGCYRR